MEREVKLFRRMKGLMGGMRLCVCCEDKVRYNMSLGKPT